MSKRNAAPNENEESSIKPKRMFLLDTPNIGDINSAEDLNLKVLVIKNEHLFRRKNELEAQNNNLKAEIAINREKVIDQQKLISILLESIKSNNTQMRNINKILNEENLEHNGSRNIESPHLFIERFFHSSSSILTQEIKDILADTLSNVSFIVAHVQKFIKKDLPIEHIFEDKSAPEADSPTSNIDGNKDSVSQCSSIQYKRFCTLSLECELYKNRVSFCQDEIDKLQDKVNELTTDLTSVNHHYDVLIHKYKTLQQDQSNQEPAGVTEIEKEDISNDDMLKTELESYKELASIRLIELEKIHSDYKDLVVENERIKLQKVRYDNQASATSQYIKQAPEYVALQYKYDLLLSDSDLLNQQLNSLRSLFNDHHKYREGKFDSLRKNIRSFRSHVKEDMLKIIKELYHTKVSLCKIQFEHSIAQNPSSRKSCDSEIFKTLDNLQNENINLKKQTFKKIIEFLDKGVICEGCLEHANNLYNFDNLKSSFKAIVQELESLTIAYEDIRTQNIQLLQQIKEIEAAHDKSITENLKLHQQFKIWNQQKDGLFKEIEQVKTTNSDNLNKIEEINNVVKNLSNSNDSLNRELSLKANMFETYKVKALELQQIASKSQKTVEDLNDEIKKQKDQILELSANREEESFKHRRILEETNQLKRKLDRLTKNQFSGLEHQYLMEEIRIYKQKLTCHCCNSRPKDAILSTCFHLFCYECLNANYNSRQRKCPRCGQNFGNHDFHKIYF